MSDCDHVCASDVYKCEHACVNESVCKRLGQQVSMFL